ncbi:MAG: DNA topoisomerase (ATP-hydrolyzing) subunit A [Christensenellales bacterium]
MIFDERDLEEEKEEDKTPLTNQMKFDDTLLNSKLEPASSKRSTKIDNDNKTAEVVKEKVVRNKKVKKATLLEDLDETYENFVNETIEGSATVDKDNNQNEKINENVGGNGFENNGNNTIEYDDEGNILKSVKSVMNEAMLPYSEYVILDRALPRVEDGLKPVQRRILYSMYELGFTPDKQFKKSAKVVGDVIANYHPHGDTSVYNAMVKLAQDFIMRETLVLGHGNFGSIDGDSAAAMRYTEVKLNELSLQLLRDIDKETVKWSYNFDDSKFEPDMLPSRFPNILVNGNMGIAVGIATNFPCHNLSESLDACIAYIDNPKITVDELMKVIKGPDFPTGGKILGVEDIKRAYETGKGKITIRAKVEVENTKNDKINLVITEFPYQVNKALCLQKIYELKEANKDTLSCITDIRDESDRNGIRAVITLKKDSDPQKIINYLYKYSDLQTTFGINMVAIAEGKPKLLTLIDILRYYTKYQKDIVYKRTKYDLNVAKEREHILTGLIIAIENIDEIVKIIKKSASTVMAKQQLKDRYELSERQAQAILDMRLSRLTNLEVEKLRAEIAELQKLIAKLTKIVNSDKLQYNIVKEEMLEIKKKYGNKRRTEIAKENGQINDEDLIKVVKPYYVLTTEKNAIKKIPEKNFNKTPRIISSDSSLNEIHSNIILTNSDKNVLILTNLGNIFKVSLDKILEARFKDRGVFLKDLMIGISPDEKALKIFEDNDEFYKKTLIIFTKNGLIKLTNCSDLQISKTSTNMIKLNDDEVVNVEIFDEKKNLFFVTKDGMSLYAKNEGLSVTGKNSQGIKGISLNEGDNVVFASQIADEKVLVVTNKGYTKKVDLSNFELLVKNRKGVKIYSLGKKESVGDKIIFATLLNKDVDLFVVDSKNKNFVVDSQNIQLTNRINKGNIIIKDRKLIDISSVYKIIDA